MLSGAINIIYALIGTSLFMIPVSGLFQKILLVLGVVFTIIACIKAIINLISALSGKINVSKLCFSLCSVLISVYGIINFVK